jgi:hypothetical protein
MARDAVANVVMRLMNCGYEPRKVGDDAWESRCPAHRSADHSLAITRNAFNHVTLECRSAHNCTHSRIVSALGLTNEHVYAETPEGWIRRLALVPVQSASSSVRGPGREQDGGPSPGAMASSLAATQRVRADERTTSADAGAAGLAGPIIAEIDRHEEGRQRDDTVRNAGDPPPLPNPLPDGARAMSVLPCDANRDVQGAPSIVAALSLHPDLPAVVERAIGELQCTAEWEDKSSLQNATTELYLPDKDRAKGGFENSVGGSMGIHFSSISVSVNRDDSTERPSAVQFLSRLASNAQLFRSADGRFCAQVPVGTRQEIFGLRSAAFRDWLTDGFLTDQPEPPSNWAIRRVIGALEARARFSTGVPEVFVRVGQDGDAADPTYYVDLGDHTGRGVAIRENGWKIVDRPAIHFRRPKGLLSLPAPARDGSINLLRPYVNLGDADFRLMVAWLTAALRPVGPYPVLVLNGEQSAGKSTLAKILRMLIDPQTCPSLALPNSTRDLMATAVNGWLLVYENITTIPGWLSDCVCQLAFGGGYASRELFTDGERSLIFAQRPVVLVGIDDFVARGDLRDRSVFINLPAIASTSRRSERKFWPEFRADYPRILGGVFDAMVGGLHALPSVHLKELPRMADYAEWGEAVGRGLGWRSETFLTDYNDNRRVAIEPLLEDSQVASLMLAFGRLNVNWSGTAQKLYESATKNLGRRLHASWPPTVARFSAELRRIAPHLRLHGLSVGFERTSGGRIVTLRTERKPTPVTPRDAPID